MSMECRVTLSLSSSVNSINCPVVMLLQCQRAGPISDSS